MKRSVPAILATAFCLFLFLGGAGMVSAATTTPTMTVSPTAGPVGAKITVSGTGYPSSASLLLEWSSANASWVVTGNPPQVTGVNIVPSEKVLLTVQTNSSGGFTTQITAPSGYGGQHTLQMYAQNGTALTGKGLYTLEPSFHVSTSSGPAGTPITITATGLGDGEYSTSYHLYWDNHYVGYMTALSGGGSTNFTIYASGVPGTHYIEIYQGYPGPGYLNPQQGPPSSETQSIFPPYIPFHAEFNITGAQSSGSNTNSTKAASLVVLAAALAAFGLMLAVTRTSAEERKKFLRTAAAILIVVAVAAAGVSAYLAFAPSSATTTSSSFTPQVVVVRPTIAVSQNNATTGPRISVTPDIAAVGQTVTVNGAGFAANSQVPISWTTRKGSNLLGFKLVAEALKNVTTDSSGSFSFSMKVPPDLGGLHYISSGNLTTNSNGTLFLERTASINATEGPAGTVVAITLQGVGWTFNTNIATLDYDNSFIGYGCGFNSGGNVTFYLTVTGEPGVQTIDIYPSVWWGTSNYYNQSIAEYRYPLLTPQDHPQLMPSFHFSFLITGTGGGNTAQIQGATLASYSALLGFAGVVLATRGDESRRPIVDKANSARATEQ